jgi:hypothetical protein
MRLHAEEGVEEILRLAVGGRWACKGEATTSPDWAVLDGQHGTETTTTVTWTRASEYLLYARLSAHVYEWSTGLESLQELPLDNSSGCKKREIEGKVLQNYREGAEEVHIDVLKYFATGKRWSEGLTWEISEARVLGWDEWTTCVSWAHDQEQSHSNRRSKSRETGTMLCRTAFATSKQESLRGLMRRQGLFLFPPITSRE